MVATAEPMLWGGQLAVGEIQNKERPLPARISFVWTAAQNELLPQSMYGTRAHPYCAISLTPGMSGCCAIRLAQPRGDRSFTH